MADKQEAAALLGVTGASIFLGIANCTVKRLADNGTLKCVRDSANKRLFKLTDLKRYQRTHKVGISRRAAAPVQS